MTIDLENQKRKFLDICREHEVHEVWINFDNPFTEFHETEGDILCYHSDQHEAGLKFIELFAPQVGSNELNNAWLSVYGTSHKSNLKEDILHKQGFKLLFIKEDGILFE